MRNISKKNWIFSHRKGLQPLASSTGANPMDTAYTWADPRVIDVIKTKFDTLPQVGDKKGGKGGKKGGGRPKTAPGSGKSKVRERQTVLRYSCKKLFLFQFLLSYNDFMQRDLFFVISKSQPLFELASFFSRHAATAYLVSRNISVVTRTCTCMSQIE